MALYEAERVIPNSTEYLVEAREFVKNFITNSSFPKKDINKIILAIDEALANIIEHAENEEGKKDIKITMKLCADDKMFEVIIRDTATKFDPTTIEDIDLETHVRSGRRNGLGIFLMRKIMDKVYYSYEEGKINELRMIKYAKN